MKTLSKPLWLLTFLTYLLIIWGAVVRASGSGLGCPDWPLCHGQIIPPFEKAVLIEYVHRLLASLVGIVTCVVCIKVWREASLRAKFGKKCGIILALLFVQVLLGGVTVKSELHPYIVTIHLGVALVFLTFIFQWALSVFASGVSMDRPVVKSKWFPVAHFLLLLVFIQILLGGMVASSNAGLICPDFPTCNGLWMPPLHGLVAWQFLHRLFAFLVFIGVLVLCFVKRSLKSAKGLFVFALLQMFLGIANILLGLPFWIRVAHSGIAVLLFLMVMVFSNELRSN